MSAPISWRVRVGEEETSAVFEPALASAGGGLFVFAHGAGGHMADRGMLAADGFACDGLLLLAYPLHPAGRPEELRDAHLAKIAVPVLCLNGTRDTLCRRDLMEAVVDRLRGRWTMHWLEGADHRFHVLKSSGKSEGDVLGEIAEACAAWASGLGRGTPGAAQS